MAGVRDHASVLWRAAGALVAGVIALAMPSGGTAAEAIKVGVIKQANAGAVFVAQEKGYFTAEGLDATIVYFESAQPIAVGVASGDLDFGVAGLTAAFYSLASQGVLRMIGSQMFEAPTFQNFAIAVSNRAYEGGLKSAKDLGGHSVAVSQMGSGLHYGLGMLAEKYHLDLATIRVLALQANSNISSALAGGQADAAIFPATPTMALVQKGEAKLAGWVGDETPWLQVGAAVTSTKVADQRPEAVTKFLRAFRHASRDYHDAFTGPNEQRKDGPTAPEIMAILAKHTGEPVEHIALGIPYFDAEARLYVKDILRQIAWFKQQGMLKGEVDGEALIDKRFAETLPER